MFIYYLTEKDKSKRIIKDGEVSKGMEKEKEGDKLPDDVEGLKNLIKKYREREMKHEKTENLYKKGMAILAVVTAILLLWQVILPFFVQGNTEIITGDEPFILQSSGGHHFRDLTLMNNGWGQSKDVRLHIYFSEGVEILTDEINKTIKPKNTNFQSVGKNECYYQWEYLNSKEIVKMELHISVDDELGTYIAPLDISPREDRR